MKAAFGAVLLAFSTPAWVHHSGAMFDREKQTTITGTVTEFNWTNPHASFRVDVANTDGKVESWAIEMNSPNNLVHQGWKRSTHQERRQGHREDQSAARRPPRRPLHRHHAAGRQVPRRAPKPRR